MMQRKKTSSGISKEWLLLTDNSSSNSSTQQLGMDSEFNLPIYNIVKLLKIGGVSERSKDSSNPPIKRSDSKKKVATSDLKSEKIDPTTIKLVATGGYVGNSFVALWCSNDILILRATQGNSIPLVRYIPWLRQSSSQIVAMTFDSTSRWLMPAPPNNSNNNSPFSSSKSLETVRFSKREYLKTWIPFRGKKDPQTPNAPSPTTTVMNTKWDSSNVTEISMIPPISKNKGNQNIQNCIWWKTRDGIDYAVIIYWEGTISFVDLERGTEERLKIRFPVSQVDLVTTTVGNRYLLITTAQNGYWQLVLEWDKKKIFSPGNSKPLFQAQQIKQFPATVGLSVHQTRQGQLIGSYDASNDKFEVYESEIGEFSKANKYPLFSYTLVPKTEKIHLMDKFIFCIRDNQKHGNTITIISKLMASGSASSRLLGPARNSIMQEFSFGSRLISGSQPGHSSPFSPRVSFQDMQNTLADGFFFWTSDTLYECRSHGEPEEIFMELIKHDDKCQGRVEEYAEPFGKTVGLDLLRLYEDAADIQFQNGNYTRASQLYRYSNVSTSKLVSQYLEIGQMEFALNSLRASLYQPAALSSDSRKEISDLLMKCYIEQYLRGKAAFKTLEREFLGFLTGNEYFTLDLALQALLHNGMTIYFLHAAHARGKMRPALEMMVQSGFCSLNQQELNFIQENHYIYHLLCNPILFDNLDLKQQIKLMLDDPIVIPPFFSRLQRMLPSLDAQALLSLIAFFEPEAHSKRSSSFFPASSSVQEDKELPKEIVLPTAQDYMEFYLSSLVFLIFNTQPKKIEHANSNHHSGKEDEESSEDELVTGVISRGQEDMRVFTGFSHTLITPDNVGLWSFGNNSAAQLGQGHEEKITTPQEILKFKGRSITDASCGAEFSVVIEREKEVWVFGKGMQGQLGTGVREHVHIPKRVMISPLSPLNSKPIAQVCCGQNFTMIRSKFGQLYACGESNLGQLGIPDLSSDVASFQKISGITGKVIDVRCGMNHTVCLTDAHTVWSWGSGEYGQLGYATEVQKTPQKIEALTDKSIRAVQCGANHTVAVTELENVYSWGCGENGRLGTGSLENQAVPTLIESLLGKHILVACCGGAHTMCLTKTGDVYTFGDGSVGQLGHGDSRDQHLPALVESLQGTMVTDIHAGENFSLCQSEAGNLFTFGSGEYFQTGHGSNESILTPKLIKISWMSSLLPEKPALELEDPQRTLETALSENFGKYRPTIILSRCQDMNNWNAAALIFQLLCEWPEAMECKLLALKNNSNDLSVETKVVLDLFASFLKNCSSQERDRVLLQLFQFWKEHDFPIPEIEKYLLENHDQLGLTTSLCRLFASRKSNPWVLDFSPNIYLHILETYQQQNSQSKAPSFDEEVFWNQIKDNLFQESSQKKREKIAISTIALQTANSKTLVLFTCGHSHPKDYFLSTLLKEFQDRLDSACKKQNFPLGFSFSLMLAEYQQQFMNMACPHCVYDTLREKFSFLPLWDK